MASSASSIADPFEYEIMFTAFTRSYSYLVIGLVAICAIFLRVSHDLLIPMAPWILHHDDDDGCFRAQVLHSIAIKS